MLLDAIKTISGTLFPNPYPISWRCFRGNSKWLWVSEAFWNFHNASWAFYPSSLRTGSSCWESWALCGQEGRRWRAGVKGKTRGKVTLYWTACWPVCRCLAGGLLCHMKRKTVKGAIVMTEERHCQTVLLLSLFLINYFSFSPSLSRSFSIISLSSSLSPSLSILSLFLSLSLSTILMEQSFGSW